MSRSLPAFVVVAMLAAPSIAVAQTGGERLPSDVRPGQMVSVVEDDGRKIEGRVRQVSERGLLLVSKGTSEEIGLDRIVRIDKPDGLKNGALIGLGVGLGLGVVGATLVHGEDAETGQVAAAIVSNALACTLLGTGIDALFNNRRTLYERGSRLQTRVAPVVGSGVRGAVIAVTW
jgi:hypothetical protein